MLQHTREPPVLAQLRAATAEQFPTGARMQISPEQGAFMGWLVQVGWPAVAGCGIARRRASKRVTPKPCLRGASADCTPPPLRACLPRRWA